MKARTIHGVEFELSFRGGSLCARGGSREVPIPRQVFNQIWELTEATGDERAYLERSGYFGGGFRIAGRSTDPMAFF